MKITIIGAGSFVFGPSALAQVFLEEQLNHVEIALMDTDPAPLDGLASVGRRMIREQGLTGCTISVHTDRDTALDGADYVVCCAAPRLRQGFYTDREIVARLLPGHSVTEFGGIAGIGYSLRQIAFITDLTDAMRAHAPGALLLTVSNPLPRVCQAAEENGVRTVGFCSVAETAYTMLYQYWNPGVRINYPFTAARDLWDVVTGGLNHHAFVTKFTERETGRDLLSELRERAMGGAGCGSPRSERILRETGFLLVPDDHHNQDFFPPRADEQQPPLQETSHGTADERTARIALLHAVGVGDEPFDTILHKPAWEKPLGFIAAHAGKCAPRRFAALNLLNTSGQIPGLPTNIVVETPCSVGHGEIAPESFPLSDSIFDLCECTGAVTAAIVRAARARSHALVREAILLDPTITDKTAGWETMQVVMDAHPGFIPAYGE